MSSSNVDLLSGEEVISSTTKHWFALLRDSFIPILMILGAFVVRWISPDAEDGIGGFISNGLDLVRTGLLVGAFGWIGYNVAAWKTATFVVTDRRVIHEEGLIRRRSSATMLTSVTDVQTRIPFIGSQLGFGDVVIIGKSGDAASDRLRSIARPMEFRDNVMAASDSISAARSGQGAPAVAAAAPPPATPAAVGPATTSAEAEQLQTLARLAELRDSGALTAEEFDAKKAEILSRI